MKRQVVGVFPFLVLYAALTFSARVACMADATLALEFVGSPAGPFPPGQNVQVKVRMSGVPALTPAAGFQAFLEYDSTRISFVSGAYSPTPFGLHILNPITAVGEEINLAAGINAFVGQTPSSADADLATLTFQILTPCGMGAVDFRSNKPPTRLTDQLGQPILPIVLQDLDTTNTCPGDVASDGSLNVADLLLVINQWGPCPPTPVCCAGNTNGDAFVNVQDLLLIITGWGACP